MTSFKDIERIVKRFQIPVRPELQRTVLDDALAIQRRRQAERRSERKRHEWRFIMNKPITKLASLAAMLVIIASAVVLLEHTSKPAYAIEQTLEAMQKARIVHMFCRDWHDDELEIWMKLNPETRLADYIYMDYPKHHAQILSTPYISYTYLKQNNIFQFSQKQLFNFDIRFENIIEDIASKLSQECDNIDINIYSGKNPQTGNDEITVLSKGEGDDYLEIGINPETKLPTRIYIVNSGNYSNLVKHFDEILFDEEPPAGLFEFKIPEGAVVVNQDETDKLEEDPESGVLLNGMTKQDVAHYLAVEYFQSLINKDFEALRKVYPSASSSKAEDVYKNLLGDYWPVELITTGELCQEYGCGIGPVLPCIVRHGDGTLKTYKLIIKFRTIDGQDSAIIAGLFGLPQPIE